MILFRKKRTKVIAQFEPFADDTARGFCIFLRYFHPSNPI